MRNQPKSAWYLVIQLSFMLTTLVGCNRNPSVDSMAAMSHEHDRPIHLHIEIAEHTGPDSSSDLFLLRYRIMNTTNDFVRLDRRGILGYHFMDTSGEFIPMVPRSIPDPWNPHDHTVVLGFRETLEGQMFVSLNQIPEDRRNEQVSIRAAYYSGAITEAEEAALQIYHLGPTYSDTVLLRRQK